MCFLLFQWKMEDEEAVDREIEDAKRVNSWNMNLTGVFTGSGGFMFF